VSPLFRFTVAILILIAAAIYGGRLIGSVHADPLSMWFTNPDGLSCATPCLFGITPGVTDFEDAIEVLRRHPILRSMQLEVMHNEGWSRVWNEHFSLYVSQNNKNRVGQMEIRSRALSVVSHDPYKLTLGHLITVLGSPDHVELGAYGSAPDYYFFFGGRLAFEAWVANNSCLISPDMGYELLTFNDHDSRPSSAFIWKGFASRRLYFPPGDTWALPGLADCSQ
jgi:hypothetical protein